MERGTDLYRKIMADAVEVCNQISASRIPSGQPKLISGSCILDFENGALTQLRAIVKDRPELETNLFTYVAFNSGVDLTDEMLYDEIMKTENLLDEDING
jgi:hypothetical protein